MFARTSEVVEKVVRVKDPLNTELVKAHTELLAEHRTLLADHKLLIDQLRKTPHWATASDTPLHYTEAEEDAKALRLAPPIPLNPFEDNREDEDVLKNAFNLFENAEFN